MRKLTKVFGFIVLSIVGLVVVAGVTVYALSNRRLTRIYQVTPADIILPTDSTALARGKHVAAIRGCYDCHGADLGGAKIIDDPAMGKIYGPNLTRGAGGVTMSYRDHDWLRAIQHGVGASGHALFLMPSGEFAHLSDDDLGALVAYLKSVPAVNRPTVPVSVGPLARALVLAGKLPLAAEIIDHRKVAAIAVKPGISPEYGRYLAVGCVGCHGENYSGGKISAGPPDWPPAANLTPHPSSRVSQWSEADFVKTLHTGHRPDGTEISSVMPRSFGQMSDDELKAIWRFLKTLPPAPTGTR